MKIAVYGNVMQYQADLSNMIMDAESMLNSFKIVKQSTVSLNGGAGTLVSAADDIDKRIQKEELKRNSAIEVKNKSNDFLELAQRVDNNVSSLVNKNKEELYCVNPWLRPATSVEKEKPWYEKTWDWLCGKGEALVDGAKKAWNWIGDTAKKAWDGLVEFYQEHKKIIDTVLIVVGAVVAIAAVIGTGGLALVPLLTTLGLAEGMATAISITVAVVAVVSTVGSSVMNVIDTWAEIDNKQFNAWQSVFNWTSVISNGFYSIGHIFNSIKGYKQFNRLDWSEYPEGAKKPKGYYRLLEGDEYDAARKVANDVNRNIHKMNPEYAGLQIHEIHPVKFGGSPSNWNNKVVLTPSEHAKYTVFWNRIMKGL